MGHHRLANRNRARNVGSEQMMGKKIILLADERVRIPRVVVASHGHAICRKEWRVIQCDGKVKAQPEVWSKTNAVRHGSTFGGRMAVVIAKRWAVFQPRQRRGTRRKCSGPNCPHLNHPVRPLWPLW